MEKYLFLFFISLVSLRGYSQAGLVKRALKQLSEKEYSKVELTLAKIQDKDSIYAGLFYTKAQLYIDNRYNRSNIDSAHIFLLKGRQLSEGLETKDILKLAKAGMDSLKVIRLTNQIDSAAFERAKTKDTEDGYLFFLKNYPATVYEQEIIELRNARAFDKALDLHTYQGYRNFMDKYPGSNQYKEAESRYERLYFEKSTSDGKLSSFKKFLATHPATPYREELEWRIFKVMTADHFAQSYKKFIRQFPDNKSARLAEQFEYHVAKENGLQFTSRYFKDSISRLNEFPTPLLFYLQGRKYGLMSVQGQVIAPAIFEDLYSEYLCNGLYNDVFLSGQALYALDGTKITSGVESFEDLGAGLIKVKRGSRFHLVHKSGYVLRNKEYEDIKLLLRQFVALKSAGKWELTTVSGLPLTTSKVDGVYEVGKFILFEKNNRLDLKVAEHLIVSADNDPIDFQYVFEDYELLENGSIWLKSADGEVVLDQKLNELIPYEKHEIGFLPFGYSIKRNKGFQLLSNSFEIVGDEVYSKIRNNQSYIVLESDSLSKLIGINNYSEIAQFNRIELFGNQFAIGYMPDSVIIYGPGPEKLTVSLPVEFELIKSTGSKEFLLLKANEDTFIVDEQITTTQVSGYKAFTATGEFLVVDKDGKKGAIANNQILLSASYDAIVKQDEGLTLLRDGKFGLHSSEYGFTVAPDYDQRIKGYGEILFTAVKKNAYTFIDNDGRELIKLNNVEAIEYWQDSLALVKKDGVWKFYDIYQNQWQDLSIKSFNDIRSEEGERRIIALGSEGYGILSSKYGEIIPLSFNDIVPLGPVDHPVYFTEKHIAEAEFYVVIYYDNNGEVIRKQAFEALDYDLIYCDR